MLITWTEKGWEDYLFWQKNDKKILQRISLLIKDICRHPLEGIGEPEHSKHSWSGYCSRRINLEHRIIYKYSDESIVIAQCRYYY